ncbi:MAG: glycoside hydrolase family 18 protein [Parachlamydiaceae bacterium]|nr:MAG: glycoside hydrolase family 18 protein [Parachlamydiaceae bacterium]
MQILKKKYPHLKTLIAIGGWTLSDRFTDIALTPESRLKFARSVVQFMHQYGFDGIDIDWEYPCGGGLAKGRPEDKQNLTFMVEEIRTQLNELEKKTGQKYFLTLASPAGDQLNHYELGEVAKFIDWYNVMAYDFHGAWEKTANHQAPLYQNTSDPYPLADRYNVAYAVQSYLNAGVPSTKIVLGLPLYSRAWSGVETHGNGLFQISSNAASGTWENGILDYADLYQRIQAEPNKYILFWDDEAKVSWVFNPYVENGAFYTYEDLKTLQEKLNFIKEKQLRGAMFWEISGDIRDASHPHSLIQAAYRGLKEN